MEITTERPVFAIWEQMVKIPGGKITLRDDRIKQKWEVVIKPFLLGRFPVTQKLYFDVLRQNPSTFFGENRPVETLTWKEAVLFCNALSDIFNLEKCYLSDKTSEQILFIPHANGIRLPTEAEWQYACQAGSTQIRYGALEDIAWYKENSGNETKEVGLKKPNEWGLYDMLGNVWEWCSDIYDENVYGTYRIFRGGGWCDHERSVMSTTRRRSHPLKFKIDDLGFRIAKNNF